MGDSGRRKERIKIPLIGCGGRAGEKDARSGGRLRVKFPKLSRVKLKAVFLRGPGRKVVNAQRELQIPRRPPNDTGGSGPRFSAAPTVVSDRVGLIPSPSGSVWELENGPRIGPRP